MSKSGTGKDPYNFGQGFERRVVELLCKSPKFFGRVGQWLKPDNLSTEAAKLAVQAAQAIAAEVGHGPDDSSLVVQRLSRWVIDGKVTYEQLITGVDLLDAADVEGASEESVIVELAPILKRREEADAVRQAMSDYGAKRDLDAVITKLERARRIGVEDNSAGVFLGPESFEDIRQLRLSDRMGFGCGELDIATDQGLWFGGFGMFMADTGGGKSMALTQMTAHAWLSGHFVGFITLELPIGMQLARLKANLTGVPTKEIVSGRMESIALDRLEELMARNELQGEAGNPLGLVVLKAFDKGTTTVKDIEQWVKDREQERGRKMNTLVIDYADELGSPKQEPEHLAIRRTFRDLSNLSMSRKLCLWSGTQTNRGERKRTRLTSRDASDGMAKMRIPDLSIGIRLSDDHSQCSYDLIKHRMSEAGMEIGPLPTDLTVARLFPVTRELYG